MQASCGVSCAGMRELCFFISIICTNKAYELDFWGVQWSATCTVWKALLFWNCLLAQTCSPAKLSWLQEGRFPDLFIPLLFHCYVVCAWETWLPRWHWECLKSCFWDPLGVDNKANPTLSEKFLFLIFNSALPWLQHCLLAPSRGGGCKKLAPANVPLLCSLT